IAVAFPSGEMIRFRKTGFSNSFLRKDSSSSSDCGTRSSKGRTTNSPPRTETSSMVVKLVTRSEEHTSELQSRLHLVCRLLLEKNKESTTNTKNSTTHLTQRVATTRSVHT